ncbi:MarR family transcriptional regulator [Sphingomonas populi]|uniref:MarR family transcriptional regulator n=1 Tax=Sphingomonas populi TaxID=2484750 RepID=A0A4Q6Y043_9SPHN|nr:MarR family transcriptional regulator [Sphingomonas populi]RZF63522.1 MarR family transcriptional regulator [Sphingomonas populi]
MSDTHDHDPGEKYGGQLHGPTSVRMWLRMLSCTMVIEKRLRRRFIDQYKTTLPRFDVLAALDRRAEGMTMGDLSQMLLVSNGNVTAIVRQLQESGFVAVEAAEHDRRSLIATLTPKGTTHFAELAVAHHHWIEEMLGDVPEEVLQQLFDRLATVKTSIAAKGTQ